MLKKLFTSFRALPSEIVNVYVLRTHLWNEHTTYVFEQMQAQLGSGNVFLLFDATHGVPATPHINWDAPNGTSGHQIITISEQECAQINRLHSTGEHNGSMHRAEAHVYACYYAIRQPYDYLWFIEYDVYSKDLAKALHPFDKISADMLTTTIGPSRYNWITRKWFWWDKLEGEISNIPTKQRRRCFFPINRFSKKFLEVLSENLSKNSGFCEVYFPTLCHLRGLTFQSFPKSLFGVFRYQPSIPEAEVQKIKQNDYRLYHPVKQLNVNALRGENRD